MKYARWIPALILAVLTLTVTASAADVRGVTVDGTHVTAVVETEADCALYAVLYSAGGQMMDFASADVTGGAGQRTVLLDLNVSVPDGGYVRAFLLDKGNYAPQSGSADSRDPSEEPFVPDTDVYAILYADGELVFQHGDTPETGHEVKATYPVDLLNGYEVDLLNGYVYDADNWRPTTPWYDDRESITSARFADTIRPVSTACWFYFCSNLAELDLSGLDTSNVTDMHYMFYVCESLTTLDVSGFDTSHVTRMDCMFEGCSGLTTLDLSGFDTSNVTDMGDMFVDCSGLTALDLSGFDTSHVTYMGSMFVGCSGLTTLDLSGFDTSNVTLMWRMFVGCSNLTTLDLSGFDTSNVTDMWAMFSGCSKLTTLDLSGFDTSNVTDMRSMFNGCSGLTTIEASASFVTDAVESSQNMFYNCTSLVGGAGTAFDSAHVDKEYARIDGGASAPGYFTRKAS